MHIIDRYLLRQFVQTFLICFVSLMGLYVVIDVSTNLDNFTRVGKEAGGVLPYIARWYAFLWIKLFDLTSGLWAMVAAMFTVSWIQRNNEMTALMAAGVSRFRVLVPIIWAVAGVSLLGVVNREVLVPRYRSELIRRPQDPAGLLKQDVKRCRDNRTNVELDGEGTYAGERRIARPDFRLMRAPSALRQYGNRLTADNAYYRPPDGECPGGYLFKGVREPKNLDTRASLYVDGEAVLITPRDADWLKKDECFFRSDVEFEQLSVGRAFEELASTAHLIAALRNPSLDYGNKERVAIHHRIVRPLLDMTLLFLGLPLVVGRESRNVFLSMGICMLVTTAFTVADMTLQHLGESGSYLISPTLAVWAPLMIFVPLAVGLSDSLRK